MLRLRRHRHDHASDMRHHSLRDRHTLEVTGITDLTISNIHGSGPDRSPSSTLRWRQRTRTDTLANSCLILTLHANDERLLMAAVLSTADRPQMVAKACDMYAGPHVFARWSYMPEQKASCRAGAPDPSLGPKRPSQSRWNNGMGSDRRQDRSARRSNHDGGAEPMSSRRL